MANEAFALSPMSARAAEPNEQDYDAIREAFMETARGRWFLGEYAKRNRNADTSMVLDAVARIEETLAAQRQPVVEDRLPEALVEIRRAIGEAEAIAIAAFDPAAIEASLAPIPRGVRIIKEISWRWREIGADGRICDLIDSQLASIEAYTRLFADEDTAEVPFAPFEREATRKQLARAIAVHASDPPVWSYCNLALNRARSAMTHNVFDRLSDRRLERLVILFGRLDRDHDGVRGRFAPSPPPRSEPNPFEIASRPAGAAATPAASARPRERTRAASWRGPPTPRRPSPGVWRRPRPARRPSTPG